MDRLTFNSVLFSTLTSVLDLSINEMAKRTHVEQQTLNRYISGKNVVPVDILIQMCNHLRMPSHFFVTENNNYDIPNREIATIAADQWHPVWWDNQAVEHTFGDGGGRIFWKDVAEVMGLTPQKPHARFLLKKRFTIVEFLKVCSHFNLSPFTFLIDPNRGDGTDGKRQKKKKATATSASPVGPSPTLLAEIAAMRQDIATLTATAADLTAKYDAITTKYNGLLEKYISLLDAHKALLQRFNDHTIGESHIGLAAESEA